MLAGVRELKKIRVEDGAIVSCPDGGEKEILDAEAPVSMNFWGFSERIFDEMDGAFRDFLAGIEEGNLTAECLLPVLVDGLVRSGRLRVRVLPTKAQWFGVTYKEDRPAVEAALRALHERGVY